MTKVNVQRHLCRSILHRNPFRTQLQVSLSTLYAISNRPFWLVDVTVKNLLREGQRFVPEDATNGTKVLEEAGIGWRD